ncbi:MAG: immunity 17 family protein [Planctomycetaceae bacterium]
MNPAGLILMAAGIFSIAGAALDWDLFINSRKARLFVSLFGRDGARIFYGLLGTVITVIGLLITLGVIEGKR